ncbi:C-type lectin domain family 14 member A [Sphaerodactylus townsendi]|uniref:C-type lectin domain family 14 member A n=1 Tax=Sphaerodactylus townsendi TaxID=933632 RepID=UPI0020262AD5|nr:C-type lectin domain family 14 member A [Sphaerodactylus townsendi]
MRGLLLASLVLLQPLSVPGLPGEPLQRDHTWCHRSGACYSVHLASLNFSGAKEACALHGGALSTASGETEIQAIFSLLKEAVRGLGPSVFWLGLVRKPPQCTYQELPLRGFSWSPAEAQETGENETKVTLSWVKEPSMSCITEKCAGLQVAAWELRVQPWGLKERSCVKASPGYICKYRYGGTCPALPLPGAENLRYTLPSRLQSADLAFSPPGTVLTLRCPMREARLTCQVSPVGYRWEGAERGLCSCPSGYWSPSKQQCAEAAACLDAQGTFLCICAWGFRLAADERSCLPAQTKILAGPAGLVTVTPTAGGALPSGNTSPWNASSSPVPFPATEANGSAPEGEAPLTYPQSSNYVFILITLAVVLLLILVMASLQVFKSCFRVCSSKGVAAGKEHSPPAAPEGDLEASATGTSSEHSLGPSKAESTEASQRDSEPVTGKVELE